MRDLSTLAKLLAEEDIHVVHRQQETAMFDVKNRELSLPIWKEMSKDVQDLMTIHEVGHALWTPLEQLEKAQSEKIEFSFVNILEDIRIEKKVQDKYLGSVNIFNRGYQELIGNNFFGTKGKDTSKLNLIDRINLHFKHHKDISFSDDEMVWVTKADQTVTPDDVLELAKELYQYIQDNPDSQNQETDDEQPLYEDMSDSSPMMSSPTNQEISDGQDTDETSDSSSGSDSCDENDDGEENGNSNSGSSSDESNDDNSDTASDGSDTDKGDVEENSTDSSSSDEKSEDTDSDPKSKENIAENQSDGGSNTKADKITSVTDSSSKESFKDMLDTKAEDRAYAFIPKINLKEVIVDYKSLLSDWETHYNRQSDMSYFNECLSRLDTFTKDNKKTVAYMVKEFEMKKAADQ